MKIKSLAGKVAAVALSAAMAITPVYAAESVQKTMTDTTATESGSMRYSEDTIDMREGIKGSITLYKLLENNGITSEADGLFNSSEARERVPNVVFSRVKIANPVNVAGTIAGSGDAVGFYYELTDDFKAEAAALGVDTSEYDTEITQGGQPKTNTYFSSEQVEAILEAMKTSKQATYGQGTDNDVNQTWTEAGAASATGETAINAWVASKGTEFSATDTAGKTTAEVDLGLYLIAEIGYVDMVNGEAKTVYRSREYSADGVMSALDNTVNTTDRNFGTYGADGTAIGKGDDASADATTSDGVDSIKNEVEAQNPTNISTADSTYYPDGSKVPANTYSVAQKGTENPYVIENPCSPFLVSVPMTNVSPISGTVDSETKTFPAGSIWQYDVSVYPKNTATSIYKKIVDDDGNTLDLEQDFNIGQKFEQVIYADAPATMFNHHYEQFEIQDTMSNGMTLQQIKRVAYGAKMAGDATELDNFKDFTDLALGVDYTVYKVNAAGEETADDDAIINVGESDDVRGFIVKLTPTGLAKISDIYYEYNGSIYATLDAAKEAGGVYTGNAETDTIKTSGIPGEKQVVVEFDSVLNENAVIGAATSNGKLQFNVNAPTLTWRHENTATRKIEGNEVKVYTYELDLTKIGKDIEELLDNTSDSQEMRDSHEFDASKAAFTVMQNKKYDTTYGIVSEKWTTGSVATTADKSNENAAAYLTFVKEADGVYHVYSPTDGPVKDIVRYNQPASEGADGNAEYAATAATAADGFQISDTGITVYQIIQPKASVQRKEADASNPDLPVDASGNEGGLLVIKGIDGMVGTGTQAQPEEEAVYTFTELSTSRFFNLLKSTFDVALKSVDASHPIKDGNLVTNVDDPANYGASVTTDGGTTGLTHHRGIVTMSVNNYKTATLHTGGAGTMAIYLSAAGALIIALAAYARNRKRQMAA